MIGNKKKYIAVFLLKQEGSYAYVGRKKFKPTQKDISYKEGVYEITREKPSYIKGTRLFYFFDIGTGQLYMDTSDLNIDPEINELITKRKIFKQLAVSLSGSTMKVNIMWLVIGLVMGVMGTISVFYFM